MRILHLIYDNMDNPWCGGGGSQRCWEINRRLARYHQITIATGNFPGAKDEEKDGMRFIRVGSAKNYLFSRLSYTLGARYVIQKEDFDLLVDSFSAFAPTFSSFFTDKPKILNFYHLMGSHALIKYPVLGRLPFWAERYAIRSYKNIVVISKSIQELLERKFKKDHVYFSPTGFDSHLLDLTAREENYILYLGRLDIYMKGLDLLLEAFSSLSQKYSNLKLVLAGRGQKKGAKALTQLALRNQILDRLEILTNVDEEQKKKLLSGCLFFCIPSRFEGWGISAMEAAACGKAVVGSDIPGLREAVLQEKTGILVRPSDPGALRQAMIRLLEDPELRRELGLRGKERAREFSWDAIAGEMERYYQRVLSEHSGWRLSH